MGSGLLHEAGSRHFSSQLCMLIIGRFCERAFPRCQVQLGNILTPTVMAGHHTSNCCRYENPKGCH
jgi:hypothetical protein